MNYAEQYNLKPGDYFAEPVGPFGLVRHIKVYMKDENDREVVAESQKLVGARVIPADEALTSLNTGTQIRKFNGTEKQRQGILRRARTIEGNNYDLLHASCEQVASYIQYEKPRSPQIIKGLALAGILYLVLKSK